MQCSWRHAAWKIYLLNLSSSHKKTRNSRNILIMFASSLSWKCRVESFSSSRPTTYTIHVSNILCGCEEIRRRFFSRREILKKSSSGGNVNDFFSLFLKYLRIERNAAKLEHETLRWVSIKVNRSVLAIEWVMINRNWDHQKIIPPLKFHFFLGNLLWFRLLFASADCTANWV